MCGIYGELSLCDNDRIIQLGEIITDTLAHRGPDDQGTWRGNGVFLGIRRLSIIDLETGQQPIFNEDRSCCIVYNGELYNYLSLRPQLLGKGHTFRTQSDTEVVLHSYEEWGCDCVQHFRGMFAFAVYDQAKEELFLARDQFGIKPLFYAELPQGFVFASELRALLELPYFPRQINWEAFHLYIRLNYIPAPWTIWAHANRLEPGHWLLVKDGRIVEKRKYVKLEKELWAGNIKEAVESLDKFLQENIRLHLIADVPVGVFLSGGLDSSLIAALAQGASESPLSTFTVTFPEFKTYNESDYARQVSQHLGTKHQEIPVSADEAFEAMVEMLDHLDEPFADSSIVPVAIISKLTSRHVKVVLSGDGGDELFAGYNKYQGLWLSKHLGFAAPLLRLISRFPIPESRGTTMGEKWRQFRKLGNIARNEPFESYVRATESISADLACRLSNGQNHFNNLAAQILESLWKQGEDNGFTGTDLWLYADANFVLPYDMLHKVDTASMRYGLEVRVPFVDINTAKLAFSFPPEWKLRNGQRKWILRKVAENYLPSAIVNRSKSGFGIPIGEWLRSKLRNDFESILDPSSLRSSGIWNRDTVQQLLNEHLQRRRDRFWELWNIFVFEWWRRKWNPELS
jgi:asparagine synthase (glutamine-hydrolysing)